MLEFFPRARARQTSRRGEILAPTRSTTRRFHRRCKTTPPPLPHPASSSTFASFQSSTEASFREEYRRARRSPSWNFIVGERENPRSRQPAVASVCREGSVRTGVCDPFRRISRFLAPFSPALKARPGTFSRASAR